MQTVYDCGIYPPELDDEIFPSEPLPKDYLKEKEGLPKRDPFAKVEAKCIGCHQTFKVAPSLIGSHHFNLGFECNDCMVKRSIEVEQKWANIAVFPTQPVKGRSWLEYLKGAPNRITKFVTWLRRGRSS